MEYQYEVRNTLDGKLLYRGPSLAQAVKYQNSDPFSGPVLESVWRIDKTLIQDKFPIDVSHVSHDRE